MKKQEFISVEVGKYADNILPDEPILCLYRSKKGLNILVEALPCLKTDITEVQRIFPIN